MEWSRKSKYSFGSEEGYRISKAFAMRSGELVALYTAWSPKDKPLPGTKFFEARNLGLESSAAKAMVLCDKDLEATQQGVLA